MWQESDLITQIVSSSGSSIEMNSPRLRLDPRANERGNFGLLIDDRSTADIHTLKFLHGKLARYSPVVSYSHPPTSLRTLFVYYSTYFTRTSGNIDEESNSLPVEPRREHPPGRESNTRRAKAIGSGSGLGLA